jgi:hypothetical protein
VKTPRWDRSRASCECLGAAQGRSASVAFSAATCVEFSAAANNRFVTASSTKTNEELKLSA